MAGRYPAAKRREIILSELQKHGHVTVAQMAEICGASEMTLRRDLDQLAENGRVMRNFGGASLTPGSRQSINGSIESDLKFREEINPQGKTAIAAHAALLVEPQSTIALDTGTSIIALAKILRDKDVHVVTNSLRIAGVLNSSLASVYILCGKVGGADPSVFGSQAIEHLRGFQFDLAFIGVGAISGEGIFDNSLEDSVIKKAMIAQAHKVVVLADQTKFDKSAAVRIDRLEKIDMVISDGTADTGLMDAFGQDGVEFVQV